MIYRRLPDCYSLPDRIIYNFKYGISCRIADRIIAVSQRTKDDITEIYGIDPEKIDVVYQGAPRYSSIRPPGTLSPKHAGNTAFRKVHRAGRHDRTPQEPRADRKVLSALPADVHLVAIGRDRGYLARVMDIARRNGTAQRITFP